MRLARVLGAIGRGLISAGVIVLLFVAYQLWGTGLQHSAAQSDLGNEFEEVIGVETATDAQSLAEEAAATQERIEAGQILAADPESTIDTSNNDGDSDGDDGSNDAVITNFDPVQQEAILAKLYPEAGEAFARVLIPDINVDQISVEGVSVEDLRKGPGHYQTTPNPGQAGNAAIAGHRTTYGAPFHRVDELTPGADIFVTTAQGLFHYKVIGFDETGSEIARNDSGEIAKRGLGYFIVSPSDTWVLDSKPNQNRLTLTACHPKYSARQRIIVQAELVGEPAPTIPRDEAVDLEVSLDSGAADERAAEADAEPADGEPTDGEPTDGEPADGEPADNEQVMSDEVAADDDPSVDADGNPIDPNAGDTSAGNTSADDSDVQTSDDDAATDADADDEEPATAAGDDQESGQDDIALASTDAPIANAEDDFGEGLNGDRTKIRPAIMWGIAGLFIWMAAWFMGKQFDRKWTLYAVGLVPFGFVLWSTFVNVDQALPSY